MTRRRTAHPQTAPQTASQTATQTTTQTPQTPPGRRRVPRPPTPWASAPDRGMGTDRKRGVKRLFDDDNDFDDDLDIPTTASGFSGPSARQKDMRKMTRREDCLNVSFFSFFLYSKIIIFCPV